MKLIELVQNNKSLRFLDLQLKREFSFKDLLSMCPNLSGEKKRLAFLYLDGSLSSVAAFWKFFCDGHASLLLSHKLPLQLKKSLEEKYRPFYIYDPSRSQIDHYKILDGIACVVDKKYSEYEVAEKINLLLSTSGTTGSPKLVKLSEDNLIQNALSILDYLPITDQDVVPLNLPLHYAYGLSVLTTNCVKGKTLVSSVKNALHAQFWADFHEYSFSSLAGTPDFYEMLVKLGFQTWTLPSLRYFTQAGGKLAEPHVRSFAEYAQNKDKKFYVMYGQTEATARMSYLAPDLVLSKPTSIGKPIKNGKFTIEEQSQELLYTGPNVFGGYATCPEDLSCYESVDVLRTGDLARQDEDGLYYITGRLSRMIKTAGARVNLDELELLLEHEFKDRFLCTSVQDNRLIVGHLGSNTPKQILIEYFEKALGISRTFLEFRVLDHLPISANGKIDYQSLTR